MYWRCKRAEQNCMGMLGWHGNIIPYNSIADVTVDLWWCGNAVAGAHTASHPIGSAQPLTSETQSAWQNVCATMHIQPLHSLLYTRYVTTYNYIIIHTYTLNPIQPHHHIYIAKQQHACSIHVCITANVDEYSQ